MAKQPVYSQPLCNVRLKTTQINSNVYLRNVTPAELMYLIADNHKNTGGDPVVEFVECDEGAEQARTVALRDEKAGLELKLERLGSVELTDEVREKRENALQTQIRIRDDALAVCARIAWIRTLGPLAERQRLSGKYPGNKLAKFYPGQVPTLPQTFEEARSHGTKMSTAVSSNEEHLFISGLEAA